jgi:hypothetical protein
MESTLFPSLPPVTVSVVVPEILPDVAVIVVVPTATEVAIPFDPVELLIVATELTEELQVTVVVISFWLLSE